MVEIDAHTMARLGIVAFILAGALFITLIPSVLIAQLTIPGSMGLLLLLWIFIWIAMIIALAITRVTQLAPMRRELAASPAPSRPARRRRRARRRLK